MCDRCIEWGGKKWHTYGSGAGSYYERTDKTPPKKRTLRLHRLVWEAENGPVPAGFDVHHVDGDRLNNAPDNLELLAHARHRQLHTLAKPIARVDWASRQHITVHCSDCGTPLERKTARPVNTCKPCRSKRAENNRKSERDCRQCGQKFISRVGNYCSQRCVNLATTGGTRCVLS